jgi:Legume lectin domain.
MIAGNKVVVLTALLFATEAKPDHICYRNFRNTTGLNLIGSARVERDRIHLLPAQANTRANVWTQRSFPVTGGFTASFSFRYTHQAGIHDANGNHGNDGLLFYIQPISNALQQDMEIPPRSLLLWFDGFRNPNVDDVSSSRLEVKLNGKRLGQTDVEPFGIRYRDGKEIRVRVDYDGDRLTIALNDKQVIVYSEVNLNDVSPGYVGFHGMGGYAYADVDIFNLTFEAAPPRSASAETRTAPTMSVVQTIEQ